MHSESDDDDDEPVKDEMTVTYQHKCFSTKILLIVFESISAGKCKLCAFQREGFGGGNANTSTGDSDYGHFGGRGYQREMCEIHPCDGKYGSWREMYGYFILAGKRL